MGMAALLLKDGKLVACGLDASYINYALRRKGIAEDEVILAELSDSVLSLIEDTGHYPTDVSFDSGIVCLPGEEVNAQWWLLTRGGSHKSSLVYGIGHRDDVERVRKTAFGDVAEAAPVRDIRLQQCLDQALGPDLDGIPIVNLSEL